MPLSIHNQVTIDRYIYPPNIHPLSNTSIMKQQIKDASHFLEDDNLAYHLQLMVMNIARYLVAIYVIGQMASEQAERIEEGIRTAFTYLGEQFVYQVTPLGEDASIQLKETN